jgi:hypothetical protein
MVFHWSCVLRLRSRIATLRIFIAIRLSSLMTAAHNRAHPIALSYSVDVLRFIALPFLFGSIYIEQKARLSYLGAVRLVQALSFDCPR